MKPVRFDDEAEEELFQAASWYEGQRESLGFEFLGEVRAAQARVRAAPRTFGLVTSVPAELRARRCPVGRFPYALVFIELADEVRVLAVAHNRRRPGYWKERL